jgi:hypothetical protein
LLTPSKSTLLWKWKHIILLCLNKLHMLYDTYIEDYSLEERSNSGVGGEQTRCLFSCSWCISRGRHRYHYQHITVKSGNISYYVWTNCTCSITLWKSFHSSEDEKIVELVKNLMLIFFAVFAFHVDS